MKDVRSLLQEYDEIKKELDSLTCLTLAPGTQKYEQAEKAGYRLSQKAYEIVEASRQIQALLDEPVGEVGRLAAWKIRNRIDDAPGPNPDCEYEDYVPASDYDDLLAKYNSLRSEKASDLEAWEELAGLFSEGKGGQSGLLVSDWEPLVIYPDSHPLAYAKIKQAQEPAARQGGQE